MYGLIAVPFVAAGAAYAMGAFTKGPSVDESSLPFGSSSPSWKNPAALERALEEEKTAFRGDTEAYQASAGRKRKTKRSKSKKNKKTKSRK